MDKRVLGKGGLIVSAIGFGCMTVARIAAKTAKAQENRK